MGDGNLAIKGSTNVPQQPSLYNALSALSGGVMNQTQQQAAGGPAGSPAPGSPIPNAGSNLDYNYSPSPQPSPLPPSQDSNPMVSQNQDPGRTPGQAPNQQPNPQPNNQPGMPGLFQALQQGGVQGQPVRQFNNQG